MNKNGNAINKSQFESFVSGQINSPTTCRSTFFSSTSLVFFLRFSVPVKDGAEDFTDFNKKQCVVSEDTGDLHYKNLWETSEETVICFSILRYKPVGWLLVDKQKKSCDSVLFNCPEKPKALNLANLLNHNHDQQSVLFVFSFWITTYTSTPQYHVKDIWCTQFSLKEKACSDTRVQSFYQTEASYLFNSPLF